MWVRASDVAVDVPNVITTKIDLIAGWEFPKVSATWINGDPDQRIRATDRSRSWVDQLYGHRLVCALYGAEVYIGEFIIKGGTTCFSEFYR